MPIFVSGLCATVLGALLIWGRAIQRAKGAALSSAAPVSLRDLTPGQGRAATGRLSLARGAEPLVTPLGGQACAFYELQILYEERYGSEERRPEIKTLVQDRASVEVLLEDETGTAELELRGAEVQGATRLRCGEVTPTILAELRSRYGLKVEQVAASRLVVIQDHLATERQLFVHGPVQRGQRRLRFETSSGDEPLLVTTQSQAEAASEVGASGETGGTCGLILLVTGICMVLGSAVKFLAR